MRIIPLLALILFVSYKQVDSDWIDRAKHEGLFEINVTEKLYELMREEFGVETTNILAWPYVNQHR